jgi:hypothetical protein
MLDFKLSLLMLSIGVCKKDYISSLHSSFASLKALNPVYLSNKMSGAL